MKKRIFLTTLCLMLMSLFSIAYGQNKIHVTGVVIDDTSEPIPGVTVKIKGTSNGTITDLDGKFNLKVPSENSVLEFSYIGMRSKQVKVGKTTTFKISMKEDSKALDEVVVIGYGSVKKKELTGAVAQVKGDEITKMLTPDIGDALQGQVAGVNITAASGAPGESSEILIRGISSITGANTPLYVVDGVAQEGDPRLSPNEVETIDVLKDAASCAIYGTRGAAGVILITTKRGKEGQAVVNFNATFGTQTMRSATPMMNANEQAYYSVIYSRNMQNSFDENANMGDLGRRPGFFNNDTDLRDVLFRKGVVPTQNYSLNFSGGKKGMTYSVMTGYYDQKGMLINSGFKRFNTRANVNYEKGKFSLSTNLTMTVEDKEVGSPGVIGQALKYSPFQDPIIPGNTDPIYSGKGDFANQINWVASAFNVEDNIHTTKASANFTVAYTIMKDMKLTGKLAWNESNDYRDYYKPYQEVYSLEGELLSKPTDSGVTRNASTKTSINSEVDFTYKKKIKQHTFNILGAFTSESYKTRGFMGTKSGLYDNSLKNFNGTTINPNVTSVGESENRLVGVLGRLLYDWKSKYMISASIRTDGSSRFSQAHRWGLFPSISGAWNISDESFFKPVKKTMNNLKLRLSHGTTGNQNFGAYRYINSVYNGYDYAFGVTGRENVEVGVSQNAFANPDIKWETTIQDNIGIDMGFFKNRVTLTAEYYNTRKKDMLFDVSIPSSGGIYGGSKIIMNVGNMINRGFELSATYKNLYKGLSYQINGTLSTNSNEITYLPGTDSYIKASDYTVLAKGYEAGAFFLYKTDGIVNTQEKLVAYRKIQPTAQMGDLIYRDLAGAADGGPDGKITDADRAYCGSGLPEFEVGLNTNLSYKGFDFMMQWYSALNGEIINGAKQTAYSYQRAKGLLSQWSEVNPYSPVPAFRGTDHDNYRATTDLWVEDGSYIRLKNITLGYSFPKNIINKLSVTKLRLFLTAQNLITITNYSGYTPEVGGGVTLKGVDRSNYPSSITYTAGLNMTF